MTTISPTRGDTISLGGLSIEITSAGGGLADNLSRALAAFGCSTRIVDAPSGAASLTLITEPLGDATVALRHWLVLEQLRRIRAAPGKTAVLEADGTVSGCEGLVRSVCREWPGSRIVCWTVEKDKLAERVSEAIRSDAGTCVLSAEGFARREIGPLVSPTGARPRSGGVWLVTGGARGVTAACVAELAARTGGHFVLCGRSAETPWTLDMPETTELAKLRGAVARRMSGVGQQAPPRAIESEARALAAGAEIRATLAAVRRAGATAEYVRMDTGDPGSVEQAVRAILTKAGAITGLVHGAGVLADRLAVQKTAEDFVKVFSPKVDGLIHLEQVLMRQPLDHIALFSSAAAFFGNAGQSDYAAANQILANRAPAIAARFAQARVRVFNWGPWDGGMVDAALAAHFKARGTSLIPINEGARIFADLLLGGSAGVREYLIGEI